MATFRSISIVTEEMRFENWMLNSGKAYRRLSLEVVIIVSGVSASAVSG